MPTEPPARKTRCRYLKRDGNRCQNEVLDDDAKAVQLCFSHATQAIDLVRELRTAIFEGTRT